MEILYILLVLLIVPRTLGELAVRVGQPALLGELVAGVLLGTFVVGSAETFPVLAHLPEEPFFEAMTALGFFLMLMAGLELRPSKLGEASARGIAVAVGGLVLPLACGVALGWLVLPESSVRGAQCLFLGVALAVTAVPVSVGVLASLGQLDTRVGRTIVSGAIVDDVLSLVLLAMLAGLLQTGSAIDAGRLLSLGGQVLLYAAIVVPTGHLVLPRLARAMSAARAPEVEFSFLVLVGLGFAVLAETLSMHFLVGPFVAGLFFVRRTIGSKVYDDVTRKVSALTHGFFAPVFFASIGIHMSAKAFVETPLFLLALLAVASFGKIVGAGLPARLAGLDRRESLAVGIGMNARGAVELIVADIALAAGLFARPEPVPPIVGSMYSAVVITAIATTFVTPIGLKALLGEKARPDGGDDGEENDAEDPAGA